MLIRKAATVAVLLALTTTACDLKEVKDKVKSVAKGDTAFTLQDPEIIESSGLAASLRHEGVYWTHNDSGAGSVLYAIDSDDGTTRAKITLTGVTAVDWEAVAVAKDRRGTSFIYVGDIGDNQASRKSVRIHRIPEPRLLKDAGVDAETYELTYQDGPRDAEALLVDPRDGTVLIASKQVPHGGLYCVPGQLNTKTPGVLRRIADAPALITDGAYSPDGSRFVLRTYATAEIYSAPGAHVASTVIPVQAQGESGTFTPDGSALLLGSEGARSDVKRVALDGAARPETPHADRRATDVGRAGVC